MKWRMSNPGSGLNFHKMWSSILIVNSFSIQFLCYWIMLQMFDYFETINVWMGKVNCLIKKIFRNIPKNVRFFGCFWLMCVRWYGQILAQFTLPLISRSWPRFGIMCCAFTFNVKSFKLICLYQPELSQHKCKHYMAVCWKSRMLLTRKGKGTKNKVNRSIF